ncbi:uncharacterized protein LOC105840133 [Monomorium pharaonis]|uniref:uncharacterized protein LOC105840133 n=1 Tax=Monomorium pharaonis TaxID=307658 RepID=UPI00063F1B7A|nr:uncharacterized protein LOC105840133 [Monomorium pharaonis]
MGQSARDIGLRPPTAMATTTAYLYGAELFVSRGVVLVLNITSAEMCAFHADREEEDRERRRRRSAREATTGTTASAFFSGFKHPLHQPLPDLSFTTLLPPRFTPQRGTLVHTSVHFPFSRRKRKDAFRMPAFARGSSLRRLSKSPLYFRFFSLTSSCSTLQVCTEKTLLIDCDRVSRRETHLDQDAWTRRSSPRREKREGG